MLRRSRSHRATLLSLAFLSFGCTDPDPIPASTEAVRLRFAEQAPLVLERGSGFVRASSKFVSAEPRSIELRGIDLELPQHGDQPLHFRGRNGVEIDVHEIGASGPGKVETNSIAYARAGGSSFWTVSPDGFEEWIHLRAGVVQGQTPALEWEVSGAPIAQDGPSVVVLDKQGIPALRVAAPVAFGRDGQEVPARMVVRDNHIELFVETNGEEVLVDPNWTSGIAMGNARRDHTVTKLDNGDLLAVGGTGASGAITSVEQWNLGSGTWSAKTSLSPARTGHTATLLPDGRVFVVGGANTVYLSTTTIYDSSANSWSAGPTLNVARSLHTMTTLPGNRLLVIGGTGDPSGTPLNSVEQLEANASGSWTIKASLSTPRYRHTVTLLVDGRVLVAGGRNTTTYQTYEIYNPTTDTWSAPKNMLFARENHTAARLPDGRVLVAGGRANGTATKTAEVYDPVTDTWTALTDFATARYSHTMTLLPNGLVYAVAGYSSSTFTNTTEFISTSNLSNAWTPGPSLNIARNLHVTTLLDDGRLLIAGGFNGSSISSVEILSPGTNGVACNSAIECSTGFCVDGVCCNTACNAGPCDACSVANGAAQDGTCTLFTGPACDDGNACTQTDSCQNGLCKGANPIVCTALDQCHDMGTCDTSTGICSNPDKPNGSSCNDGNACTQTDTCDSGACVGANPVTCLPLDQCHVAGTCDPATGTCSNPNALDGLSCNDNDACTQVDVCQAGTCTGTTPVVCTALDVCHEIGVCDPVSGICSNPVAAPGKTCADAACYGSTPSGGSQCDGAGNCSPVLLADCAPFGCQNAMCIGQCNTDQDCASDALCIPSTGECANDADGDGIPNTTDNCPTVPNTDQANSDNDPDGDLCDSDDDNDGIPDFGASGEPLDLCPTIKNPGQNGDSDGDGVGDPCDCKSDATSLPDGTACDDGNLCTLAGTCQAGACVSTEPKKCPPPGVCQVSFCNPSTGGCINASLADNTLCVLDVGGVSKPGVCLAGSCLVEENGGNGSGGAGGLGGGGSGENGGTNASGGGTNPSGTGANSSSIPEKPGLSGTGLTCQAGKPGSTEHLWLFVCAFLVVRAAGKRSSKNIAIHQNSM